MTEKENNTDASQAQHDTKRRAWCKKAKGWIATSESELAMTVGGTNKTQMLRKLSMTIGGGWLR